MADNYGPTQPVVYDPKDHSWDNVVFGQGIPVKSADWNLISQLSQERAKQSQLLPSGWLQVGDAAFVTDTVDAEQHAVDGQIITSLSYTSDTFKLVSKGDLRAIVAGMSLDIRGTNSLDDNNVIIMESTSGVSTGRLDFVFLEVWRELVTSSSVVYKYGNVDASTLTNDLDTAYRVQIRYRIRTKVGANPSSLVLSANPDGFSNDVRAEGALPDGSYTLYNFLNQVDNGDPGLWRAGDGSDAAKDALGTVDGYSYAIPMLAVYRRGHSSGFSSADITSSKYAKGDAVVSDRPDGLYYDVVYPSDIVDLRHRVLAGRDISALLDKTFRSLTQGTLRTRQGLVRGNAGYVEMPGGSSIMKGEEFGANTSGLPYLGNMQSGGILPQRVLCNATVLHNNNVIEVAPPSGTWSSGTSFVWLGSLDVVVGAAPTGSYRVDTMAGLGISDITFINSSSVLYVTIPGGSTLIGSTTVVKIQLPVTYLPSATGLLDVPDRILEIRVGDAVIPPSDGSSIPAAEASLATSAPTDYIENRGAEAASTYDQGINVVTHLTMPAPNTFHLALPGYMLYGHTVVGIKSIQRAVSPGVYGSHESFGVERLPITGGVDYLVTGITSTGGSSLDVKVTFQSSTKFFETSKQGRGITETFETTEVTPLLIGGSYYVDTGSLPLLSVCQCTNTQGDSIEGLPYAYVNGQKRLLEPLTDDGIPLVNRLPVVGSENYVDGLYLPTRCKIQFQGSAPIPADTITVPVVVNSGVSLSQSHVVYYQTSGYQGTSSSEGMVGTIEAAGPNMVTTSGSGAVADYSMAGSARFGMLTDKRIIEAATGTNWTGLVYPGDYIFKTSQPSEKYRVDSVESGTSLTLVDPYYGASEEVPFKSVRKGVPASGSTCVIDRMPSSAKDGYLASSKPIWSTSGVSVSGLPGYTVADPVSAMRGDVKVGSESKVYQGRTGLLLSLSGSDRYQLPRQFADVAVGPVQNFGVDYYQKLHQSYLFVEAVTGKIYMVVVTGETQTNNELVRLTGHVGTDAVDVFEIIGRPLAPRG